ncbi:MAG: hypothetical protein O3B22_10070 [Proteobacteria bacterium]|nr:hypothetical protein [Pseudomonadota bacterium]MDA1070725.1 hypothetical protein [Pseudomonadota bacterium]
MKILHYAALLAAGMLAACAAPPAEAPAPTLNDIAFAAAMADAAGQSAADIDGALFAIADDNPALVWRDAATREEVLVVSLMSQAAYDRYWKGKETGRTYAGAPVSWVTAAPQVQQFCSATGLAGDALALRLKQYLGLRPERSYDVFVEMWIDRDDLFRPCPDLGIDDRTCELAFPLEGGMPVAPAVKGVPDYLAWFEGNYAYAYGPEGAPWTRLGYTYDWNPATPKFGASEYLVTTDVPYEIARVVPVDTYCTP